MSPTITTEEDARTAFWEYLRAVDPVLAAGAGFNREPTDTLQHDLIRGAWFDWVDGRMQAGAMTCDLAEEVDLW